jgi:prepilin-type N-terminal cleavage/methylation domain-containing protein
MSRGIAASRGFSLIELLVCAAIVAILAGISIVSYQGALDNQDLKYTAPVVAGKLERLRNNAAAKGFSATVEFQIGTQQWIETRRKGDTVSSSTESVASYGLIRRRLRFLRYEWPDGSSTPPTFTFTGGSSPQGGTVYFGTWQAETAIRLENGRVYCDMGVRD